MRFTAITGVNTLFNGLMNTSGFAALDFSSLRISEMTGVALLEGYGLTETLPSACMNPLHLEDYTGTVGVPMPSTECRVIDDAGNALPTGTPGELCVRGPQVMRGYWNRSEDTAEVLDDEGWLRTGDVAEMDASGFFRIVDRKKDMILVSGFNVYPNEVEEVVSQHPEVLEVGAIGVADERSGEAVKIVVVKRSPGLTEESLRAYCEEHLAGYKRPPVHRVHARAPEDQRREDPAPRAARAVRTVRPGRRVAGSDHAAGPARLVRPGLPRALAERSELVSIRLDPAPRSHGFVRPRRRCNASGSTVPDRAGVRHPRASRSPGS